MNRRSFLKRMSTASLVAAAPGILIPERKFWSLDQSMLAPSRAYAGDYAFLQWHFDRGLTVPGDVYTINPGEMLTIPAEHVADYMSGRLVEGYVDERLKLKIQWPNDPVWYGWLRESGWD